MIKIPGGVYSTGYGGDKHVRVAPFSMDVTEVTVASYRRCVAGGHCTPPNLRVACNWKYEDREDHPINCVDWHQANAYCTHLGKRLPSEEEWEWAALSVSGHRYVWGNDKPNEWDVCVGKGFNNTSPSGKNHTCPVASKPRDRSKFGLMDMSANVSEWTATKKCGDRCEEPNAPRVVRGAAFTSRVVTATQSWNSYADRKGASVGFRCAQ